MNYPKLYKVSVTGAPLVWWMEQSEEKYRMHSGQFGGKLVTTAWTTAKPKNVGASNETTPVQQATAEINSAYALKRKKGYRDTVDAALNSDRFQCMLAENFNQKHKEADASYARRMANLFDSSGRVCSATGEAYAQPKLDGIRCIASQHGLHSRSGDRIHSAPHIQEALAPLFQKYPTLILDGELYNHTLHDDFNALASMITKTKPSPEDLVKSRELVEYWVYDNLYTNCPDVIFETRFYAEILVGLPEFILTVPTYRIEYREEFDALYENFLEAGYEGAMYRLNTKYEHKRTYALLKRKERMDAEFRILGFREGEGNAAGMAKIADMELVLPDGTHDSFKADICGTREECREYLRRRDEAVGKWATIEFQNYTPDGVPRFPKLKTAHFTPRW